VAFVFPVLVPAQSSPELKEFRAVQIRHHPVRRFRTVPMEDLVTLRILLPYGVIGWAMIWPANLAYAIVRPSFDLLPSDARFQDQLAHWPCLLSLESDWCPAKPAIVGVLHQNLEVARGFQPFSVAEMQTIRDACRSGAADGHLELFKTTKKYDGDLGREMHGFEETVPSN
jgi:hypothetical protein